MTAKIRILVFGGAKQILGSSAVEFPLAKNCTVKELLDMLCQRYPNLQPHQKSIRLAVNGTYATLDETIAPDDEVALIPPVAGG